MEGCEDVFTELNAAGCRLDELDPECDFDELYSWCVLAELRVESPVVGGEALSGRLL